MKSLIHSLGLSKTRGMITSNFAHTDTSYIILVVIYPITSPLISHEVPVFRGSAVNQHGTRSPDTPPPRSGGGGCCSPAAPRWSAEPHSWSITWRTPAAAKHHMEASALTARIHWGKNGTGRMIVIDHDRSMHCVYDVIETSTATGCV